MADERPSSRTEAEAMTTIHHPSLDTPNSQTEFIWIIKDARVVLPAEKQDRDIIESQDAGKEKPYIGNIDNGEVLPTSQPVLTLPSGPVPYSPGQWRPRAFRL
jgi:hypothetical protein